MNLTYCDKCHVSYSNNNEYSFPSRLLAVPGFQFTLRLVPYLNYKSFVFRVSFKLNLYSIVLAVGYASGQVILCDIEDSSVLHTSDLKGKVTCMSWVDRQMEEQQQNVDLKNDVQAEVIKEESFLPKLPPFSKSYTAANKSQR